MPLSGVLALFELTPVTIGRGDIRICDRSSCSLAVGAHRASLAVRKRKGPWRGRLCRVPLLSELMQLLHGEVSTSIPQGILSRSKDVLVGEGWWLQ